LEEQGHNFLCCLLDFIESGALLQLRFSVIVETDLQDDRIALAPDKLGENAAFFL
jgi:hypothetical protein